MFLATLILSPLFSDHMVLQRDSANPLWGKDTPGQVVAVKVETSPAEGKPAREIARATITTAPDGRWKLACPALPTGGPYRIHIQGSSTTVLDDVLVGEVWLASGQSNMEWKLAMTDGADKEIGISDDSQLRMFTGAKTTASSPQESVAGDWKAAAPRTSADFSAVGYYFAKELRRHLHVPVGIINVSWGGTRVEAWTSREALAPVFPVEKELAELALQEQDLPRIRAEFGARTAEWEAKNFPSDGTNEGEKAGWHKAPATAPDWKPMALPSFWQTAGMHFNGCVWFRRTVQIPAAWAGRELVLELGAVDDFDTTYFNGEVIGVTPRGTAMSYSLPRQYRIPAAQVKAGEATLAVRVFDQFGDGGFAGPASAMRIHPVDTAEAALPLAGEWLCRVEREVPTVSGAIYATSPVPPAILQRQNNPAHLYNGMIAPVAGYGIRGAIWYQGEANVEVAEHYADRLTAMIRDWRTRWGRGDFDFLQVQLATYKASPDWPFLREAQTRVLAEPATGMAVTLDIGNPADIHPRNKAEVGRRLALIARAKTYGEKALLFRGPSQARVRIDGAIARVTFENASGLRLRRGATELRGFELAGADGIYHPATARIEGTSVFLSAKSVPLPCTVRYGWDSAPDCTLENVSGLPAEPFRTDGQPVPR